jgi:hypothetical protein
MNAPQEIQKRDSHGAGGHGAHGGHGLLAMLACCIPMVAVFVLIALRVI